MVNYKGHPPKKNHPWKNSLKSEVHNWAKEKSYVSRESGLQLANLETIKCKSHKPKQPQI